MKPEDAVSWSLPFGPYAGLTLGEIAKFKGLPGLLWLLHIFQSQNIRPETWEPIRAFFACPRYGDYFKSIMGGRFPGSSAFWTPPGTYGCRACKESGMRVETDLISCIHGIPKGARHRATCACGFTSEVEMKLGVDCETCRKGTETVRLNPETGSVGPALRIVAG